VLKKAVVGDFDFRTTALHISEPSDADSVFSIE